MKTPPNCHDLIRFFAGSTSAALPEPQRAVSNQGPQETGHDFLLMSVRPDLLPEPSGMFDTSIRR